MGDTELRAWDSRHNSCRGVYTPRCEVRWNDLILLARIMNVEQDSYEAEIAS